MTHQNDELATCGLCGDTYLSWQADSHIAQKHHSLIAYTIRVENLPIRNICEACALEVIGNYSLEKSEFMSWYSQDLPDATDITVRQYFSNAKLFESGCSICLGNY